jgi:hypothetical protein
VFVLVIGNAVGAFASLGAGLADRWGRANLVVGGLLLTGLLVLFALPNATSKAEYTFFFALVSIVEFRRPLEPAEGAPGRARARAGGRAGARDPSEGSGGPRVALHAGPRDLRRVLDDLGARDVRPGAPPTPAADLSHRRRAGPARRWPSMNSSPLPSSCTDAQALARATADRTTVCVTIEQLQRVVRGELSLPAVYAAALAEDPAEKR